MNSLINGRSLGSQCAARVETLCYTIPEVKPLGENDDVSHRIVLATLMIGLLIVAPIETVFAQGVDSRIDINGFLTVAGNRSDTDVPTQDGTVTEDIGFDRDSRIGVQIRADVNERIGVTTQFLGRARRENYDAFFDWGYIDYRLTETLTVRGGKHKFPTFLVSDFIEVGYAYPWIRPPEEVYFGNPITTMSGLMVVYQPSIGPFDFNVQPYFGTGRGDALIPQEALASPGTIATTPFNAENLLGANLSVSYGGAKLRVGALDTDVSVDAFGVDQDEAQFLSVGGVIDQAGWVFYTEWFQREIEGEANQAFPNQQGWYVTVGHRFGPFLPHFTYAALRDNNNPETTQVPPAEQDSLTAALRYEIAPGADAKFEVSRTEPRNDSRGLFVEPVDEVLTVGMALDVIF